MMRHPLIGKSIVYYIMAWVVIITAHVVVIKFHYNIEWSSAIADGVIFNSFIAVFGLSLWWPIQFLTPSHQGTASSIVAMIVVVVLGSYAINYADEVVMVQLCQGEEKYQTYASAVMPWKHFIAALYLCMTILIYFLIKHNYSLKDQEKQHLELQNLLKHSELEMLKFQINPHFIFNSLNSISALTISAPEQAHRMVIKLSDFLRASLGTKKAEVHSLEEELNQMNLYLDIEKVRFGERLTVHLKIDSACKEWPVPNMIMQPLYENAIKYGVYEQLDAVEITTSCKIVDNNMELSVTNNYDSEAVAQKGKGIGLKNVRNRLELIYGFPDLVTIERAKKTFTVKLIIPRTTS